MIPIVATSKFDEVYSAIKELLITRGSKVPTERWQGISTSEMPGFDYTIELQNLIFDWPIPDGMPPLQWAVNPNLPWAEDHFQERVGREPLNPGREYKNWPFYRPNLMEVEHKRHDEQFSHTYMERYWPKRAGNWSHRPFNSEGMRVVGNLGLWFAYGDLDDLILKLHRMPYTRQAYLPIFFPEDTGAEDGRRVPCTLGYHFMLREGKLHCVYPIRSCDFIRHFRDDVYMTCRLVQWVLDQLREVDRVKNTNGLWHEVTPGTLTFHAYSMHVFQGDTMMVDRWVSDR